MSKFPFVTVTLGKLLVLRGYFGAADEVIVALERKGDDVSLLKKMLKEAKLERLLKNIKKRKTDGIS